MISAAAPSRTDEEVVDEMRNLLQGQHNAGEAATMNSTFRISRRRSG